MDVYGIAPTTAQGEYFRNSVWSWHPLWTYCCEVAPDLIPSELAEAGHYNAGAGLDADGAVALAERLKGLLRSGEVKRYETAYRAELASLQDEICAICGGTGLRLDPPAVGPGDRPCNGCGGDPFAQPAPKPGTGRVRPFDCHYPFESENVSEFVGFLLGCGGFTID
jgi:hypothetical protein